MSVSVIVNVPYPVEAKNLTIWIRPEELTRLDATYGKTLSVSSSLADDEGEVTWEDVAWQ